MVCDGHKFHPSPSACWSSVLVLQYLILQFGNHPLYTASYYGRLDIVKLLFDHGAQTDLPTNVSYHCNMYYQCSLAIVSLMYVRTCEINIHVCNSCRMTLVSLLWVLLVKKDTLGLLIY